MLKDFIEISAILVENFHGSSLDRVVFRGKDIRTCLRRAIRAGADINMPYVRTWKVFGSGARKVRASLKREYRRRARHTQTVLPRCIDWEIT